MNPTIEKFGYPASLVREFDHWLVLVRPAQVTLGSLVLAARSDATAYGELPRRAFAEQADAVAAIETGLSAFCRYQRINYLMLMMVDPHVHFHVIPRYSGAREWHGLDFVDQGWPGPADLKSAIKLSLDQISALRDELAKLV
ncbi:HIT family protein [Sphingomonas sp.]|uniref:HIT family protein n=1 Tax=Sphingomonas sp. TaxID=28214 RepID=UPI0017B2E9B9|nr:HIT family protein [Sphingomonas sp.]MBA3511337.1 HIT family protein [Sphingomonas sp.]